MFWMVNVRLNKLSWRGAVGIHSLVSCLSWDQRSILTTSGDSILLLRVIHFKGGEQSRIS
ncbi:unnamed protein product [Brassica napus]|nr:unnamed protein product [Brassica napus]